METVGRIRFLEKNIVYQGWSCLCRYVIQYTRKTGFEETQVREIYDSGDGAAVLLYHPLSGNIILVRQFRLAAFLNGHKDGFLLEACAGLLDENDAEKAILKEILEETGYEARGLKRIYTAFASPGAHMEKIHFFVATYDEEFRITNGGGEVLEQEEIEVEQYHLNEVRNLINSGEIQDAKTLILLQWALLHLVEPT